MHDQIAVCMRNGDQYIQKESNPGFDIETMVIAVAIDLLPFHVFKDKIRLAGGGYAGVEQLRDVRMYKAAEDPALAFESLLADFAHQRDAEKLHRYLALESTVVSLSQPDTPHPALADL